MPILVRYLLRELVVPLIVWVAFLFVLLVVMQFLRTTEVLLGAAVTAGDLGKILLYMSPHFLVMALPVAFLLSILLGFGRLAEDRELVALHALGVSPLRLTLIPAGIGAVLGLVVLVLIWTGEPWGLRALRAVLRDVVRKNVVSNVKPGVFQDMSQMTLYAEQVSPEDPHWRNVLIHDDRDPASPQLLLAREGRVSLDADGAVRLSLIGGALHLPQQESSTYTRLSFERGDLALPVEEPLTVRTRFRSSRDELTPGEVLEAAEDAQSRGEDPRPLLLAFHSRVSQAMTPLAFALLGTPIALGRKGGGRARGFVVTLGGYVGYYVLGRLCEGLALSGRLPLALGPQVPNLLFALLGAAALASIWRSGASR